MKTLVYFDVFSTSTKLHCLVPCHIDDEPSFDKFRFRLSSFIFMNFDTSSGEFLVDEKFTFNMDDGSISFHTFFDVPMNFTFDFDLGGF